MLNATHSSDGITTSPVKAGLCFSALSAIVVERVVMEVLMSSNSPCRVVTPFRETLEASGKVTTPLNVGSAKGAFKAIAVSCVVCVVDIVV